MKVLTNGYYRNDGFLYEESHGGGLYKSKIYIYIKFNNDKTIYITQKSFPINYDLINFDFLSYVKKLIKNQDKDYLKGYRGYYQNDGSEIKYQTEIDGKNYSEMIYIISDNEIMYKDVKLVFMK